MPAIERRLALWHQAVQDLITLGDTLSPADWATPVGDRTVRGTYAHLVAYAGGAPGRGYPLRDLRALTYDNARLAQAMLAGAVRLGDADLAARAVEALDWYVAHVGLSAGMLRCVGNRWHRREDDPRSWRDDGDEQPIDAAAATEALVEAWHHTGDPRYGRLATWAYAWFVGRNRVGARLYVEGTGGCHDGLSATAANPNQGAESTLAYYQALLSLAGAGLAKLPTATKPTATTERATNRPARTATITTTTTEGPTDAG